MLEINASNLKNDINELNRLINEYEEIQLNLFNQLKDSCINWQDGNSIVFDNKIHLEKQETLLVLQNLKSKKNIYDFIYTKYCEFGKNLSCNLNNKSKLLLAIANCESQFDNIISEFKKIDHSFYYFEYQNIMNNKNKIVESRNKLIDFKNNITKIFIRIQNIEQQINNKINKLEEIKINNFDFYLN